MPKIDPEEVDFEISKQTVQEALVKAKSLIPLLSTADEVPAAVKAAYAAKVAVMPYITTSMARKVNTGDYENLDFFFSVQVPLALTDEEAQLHAQLCDAAIQQGIDIVNPQVNERYAKVKAKVREKTGKKP